MDRKLLKVTEAAEMLGLSRSYLYELIAANQIETVLIGAARRIRPQDLDAFVEKLRDQSQEMR